MYFFLSQVLTPCCSPVLLVPWLVICLKLPDVQLLSTRRSSHTQHSSHRCSDNASSFCVFNHLLAWRQKALLENAVKNAFLSAAVEDCLFFAKPTPDTSSGRAELTQTLSVCVFFMPLAASQMKNHFNGVLSMWR